MGGPEINADSMLFLNPGIIKENDSSYMDPLEMLRQGNPCEEREKRDTVEVGDIDGCSPSSSIFRSGARLGINCQPVHPTSKCDYVPGTPGNHAQTKSLKAWRFSSTYRYLQAKGGGIVPGLSWLRICNNVSATQQNSGAAENWVTGDAVAEQALPAPAWSWCHLLNWERLRRPEKKIVRGVVDRDFTNTSKQRKDPSAILAAWTHGILVEWIHLSIWIYEAVRTRIVA
ncbi:hypothetical protein M413DRAFT_13260 [Hebeloma cylindrosporum]|uniref:Uncharacterized protein n=1 Tax=Hebeloma cylindrosporum TaxID=76867 RepID=A0A0C2Y946_HEBCY|nr:hypothetical protein M413DRAFT_13260 [Hebeloma cylindrosporum h7]